MNLVNTKLSNGASVLTVGNIANIILKDLVFKQVVPVDPSDTLNYLVNLNEITSTVDRTITISNITVEDCSVSVLTISNSQQYDSVNQELSITGISINNGVYPYKDDLMVFSNIQSAAIFQMNLRKLVIHNVTFNRGGNLILFSHQPSQALVFEDSSFSDITNAGIMMESFDQNTASELPTKVNMVNITANNIDAQNSRFISLYEGAQLSIQNSTFTHITNTRTGAVLYAGYQKAKADIYDSRFVNNTSIEGAVFNVEEESVIK